MCKKFFTLSIFLSFCLCSVSLLLTPPHVCVCAHGPVVMVAFTCVRLCLCVSVCVCMGVLFFSPCPGEKVMQDDEFTCDLFRFLQLLCEGHNSGACASVGGREGGTGGGLID